jgi:hypothetical protein
MSVHVLVYLCVQNFLKYIVKKPGIIFIFKITLTFVLRNFCLIHEKRRV